jgi:hypothetical protein
MGEIVMKFSKGNIVNEMNYACSIAMAMSMFMMRSE